ncbi:MAG: hypothetical protein ACRC6K_03610 [Fusobacteriaceae bacterium]
MLKVKKKEFAMVKRKKVIIHDLPDILSRELFLFLNDDYKIINANIKSASCNGCFKCWLQTPGICQFKDKFENIGEIIFSSEKLIIITQLLYGGLSIPIKKVIDRSIPGITPFFKKRYGKLHHLLRYKTQISIKTIFYNVKNSSKEEIKQSKNYIEAMSINYNSIQNEIIYIKSIDFSKVSL